MSLLTAKDKTVFGLKPIDLLGILIMIIPFFISFKSFTLTETGPAVEWWFIRLGKTTSSTQIDIKPGVVSALCAVSFYFAVIVRFNLFKADTLLAGIISAVRTFLNCFVIAALLSTIITTHHIDKPSFAALFQNYQTVFLLMGILLSWIGMRTISGYCWILFVIAAWNSLSKYDEAMGVWGALFVITVALSLFLQMSAHIKVSDFAKEFRGDMNSSSSSVRNNMSAAAADAAQRAEDVSTFAKNTYTRIRTGKTPQNQASAGNGAVYYVGKNAEPTAPTPSRSMPSGDTGDILKALDVNGDGVVDEKDIELLRRK